MTTMTPQQARNAMIRALSSARPGHDWDEGRPGTGCSRCPRSSPFREDRASHPYIIEEEL